MQSLKRLLIGGVAGLALMLTLGAGTAPASRSIEFRGGPNIQSEGVWTFGREAAKEIRCNVTFLETITRSMPKTPGTAFGRVTGIVIDRSRPEVTGCRPGADIRELREIRFLLDAESPGAHREISGTGRLLYDLSRAPGTNWAIQYNGFEGTLPGISRIRYRSPGIRIKLEITDVFGATSECLSGSSGNGSYRVVSGVFGREGSEEGEGGAGRGALCPELLSTWSVRTTNISRVTIALL